MTTAEILQALDRLGVSVEAIPPDRLRLRPADRIPDDLRPVIVEAKPQILAVLRRDTGAGTSEQCGHCHGTGECNCVSCGRYEPRLEWVASECNSCQGVGSHPNRVQ